MLALSSLTRKAGYVVLMWCGMWIGGGIVTQILESVLVLPYFLGKDMGRMQRWQQRMNESSRDEPIRWGVEQPGDPQEGEAVQREREKRKKRRDAEAEKDRNEMLADFAELKEAWSRDWRLLPSFTQNLLRIGDALLGTYDAQ